jgi:4-hydroxy-tetrahydrodipicolinate synthase
MFRGSIVAVVTPFTEDYKVDFDAYGRLVDMHLAEGTHGIVPCGCTGEAATLSHDEQHECIKFVVERVAGRMPVIAGTGSNNTSEAISLTKHAKDVGADAALVITPYYNKPTEEGQIAHYRAIADAAEIPIMLYNVPGRTATKMSPETVATLGEHPHIVSIKEACGSVGQVSGIRALSDIVVMSGDDPLTLPMMAVGATGVVSVAANVAPAKSAALCNAFLDGDLAKAQALHYELLPLYEALFFESNPIPVKAAMAEMGLIKNVLRLPLTPMRAEPFARLLPVLEQLGLGAPA